MCGAEDGRRPEGFSRPSHWVSIDVSEPPNSPVLGKVRGRAAGPREKSLICAKSARGPTKGLLPSLLQDHGVLKPGNNRSCNPCSLLRVRRGFVWRHSAAVLFHLEQSAPRRFTATQSTACRGQWRQRRGWGQERGRWEVFAKLRTPVCESAPNKWKVELKVSRSRIPTSSFGSRHGLCGCHWAFGRITWVEGHRLSFKPQERGWDNFALISRGVDQGAQGSLFITVCLTLVPQLLFSVLLVVAK